MQSATAEAGTSMGTMHPLIGRLVDGCGAQVVSAARLDTFCAGRSLGVLFFTGDPLRHGETLDVAVILPELRRLFASRGENFAVGLVQRSDELALQTQFGFRGFPSLIFLRHGRYLGTVTGVLDWLPFVEQVGRILASEPSRPPSVGIAVAGGASPTGCQ